MFLFYLSCSHNLKVLFDIKQNAIITYYVQTNSSRRTVFVTIRLGVYINTFLEVLCLSPKPSIIDFWLLLTPLEVNIAYLY